jgi:DNA-binding winged helix-turn-helix (wHTH) protein/TolB-like protein/tetratricopeptide (TPR) repeat protein
LYVFNRFRFDPINHLLVSEGTPVSLKPKAFEVLLVLVRNGSRLTTKEELMQKVWPDSFVGEANLTVNVSALRKLLGTTPDRQPYIETVSKKGYRFVVPVTEVQDEAFTSPGTPPEPAGELISVSSPEAGQAVSAGPIEPQTFRREASQSRLIFLVIGLLLVIAAGAAYFTYRANRRPDGHLHRLAVLPFQNLRTDPGSDFLGFSLADAVISKLGYVSELSVRPSYAVQKYKNFTGEIGRVASELDVDTLLAGTFLREGDDLRIACQLIAIKTQNVLWKGVFDVKYEKLLTVQDRVANQIIRGLELTLSPSEVARVTKGQVVHPLAYEYFLRGIDLYSNGDFPMAIKLLEKSAELAPDYAPTWAHLGRSYNADAGFQFGGTEEYRRAQKAFERALVLQPDQIEARIYMANMLTDTGRVERAVPLLRDALKANPNHAELHWELGYAYRFAGLLQESVLESEKARQLDPVVKLNSSTPNGYLYLGQYDRFLESLPKGDDSALIAFYRGFAEYHQSNWEEAAKHFDRALELDHLLLQSQVGKALESGIRHDEPHGLAILRVLEMKIDQHGVGDPEARYKIAQSYAVLGDQASAFRVLKQSIENGFFPYPYFLTDPLLNSLRSKGEFSELMAVARQRHLAFVRSFSVRAPGQSV